MLSRVPIVHCKCYRLPCNNLARCYYIGLEEISKMERRKTLNISTNRYAATSPEVEEKGWNGYYLSDPVSIFLSSDLKRFALQFEVSMYVLS